MLWRDILNGNQLQAFRVDNTSDMVLVQQYKNWINSLTEDNTILPTSFSSSDEIQYFYFLDKFRDVWPNYNKPVDLLLKPNAMLSTFSSINACL